MAGLVAWGHQATEPAAWRVTVVSSLEVALAARLLPMFEAALVDLAAAEGRRVVLEHFVLPAAAPRPPELAHHLAAADLVVSFGAGAAESLNDTSQTPVPEATAPGLLDPAPARRERGATARRLVALPAIEAVADQAGETAGTPRLETESRAALAIAQRLLAGRAGPPLRIGVLHEASGGGVPAPLRQPLAGAELVPLPLGAVAGELAVTEAAVLIARSAAARPMPVDVFWLALERGRSTATIVRAIVQETGKPVLHAQGRAAVAAGALFSVTVDTADFAGDAATAAVRLLAGPTGPEPLLLSGRRIGLALNLTTAERLGVVPPHELVELTRGRLFR